MECEIKSHEFLELCDKQELTVNGAYVEIFNVAQKLIEQDEDFAATLIVRMLRGDLSVVQDARLFAKAITNEIILHSISVEDKALLSWRSKGH